MVTYLPNFVKTKTKTKHIIIVNGRIGEEKLSSTVEYVICSMFMFELFEHFYIYDFCNLYSDVNCPITCELISQYHIETSPTVQPRDENNCKIAVCNSFSLSVSMFCLCCSAFSESHLYCQELFSTDTLQTSHINNISSKLCNLFLFAADVSVK